MGKTKAEMKAELMAEVEREIDSLLEWESQAAKVTLTDIEDKVLAARRRLSERIASELAQARAERMGTGLEPNSSAGKPLHRKGKKTGRVRRGSGS